MIKMFFNLSLMEMQVELVRHVSSQQPVLAASKVAERLQLTFSSSTFESVSSKVWLEAIHFNMASNLSL